MALIVFSWPEVYFRWWHFPVGKRILFVCQRVWIRNMMKCCWEAEAPVYCLCLVFDESWTFIWSLIHVGLRSIMCLCSVCDGLMSLFDKPHVCNVMNSFWHTSPWILSICPSFRAAPRTLQSVRTILSALASERKALESSMDFLSPTKTDKQTNISH